MATRRKSKPRPRREPPKIEQFLPRPIDGRWSGRRNITIWLSEEIIEACHPHPASKLRVWIENNFPKK